MLDAGAGFGAQLVPFREAGHQVRALERSVHRARHIEDVLDIPCERTTFEAVSADPPLDLIVVHHVLEHVSDPAGMVAHCRELLVEGGLLYLAVPNLWQDVSPQTLLFAPHLSAFTAGSLALLLERHGFELVRAVEDTDLQVLARQAADSHDHAPGGGDFEARLAAWLLDGFGGSGGPHTVLWTKSPAADRVYERRVLSRRAAQRTLAVAQAVERIPWGAPRRAARRRLPPWTRTRSLRCLTVDADRAAKLPVELSYPGHEAPVWVK